MEPSISLAISSDPSRRKLAELLAQSGALDALQLQSALGHQRQWGGRLGQILIELHFIDDLTLARILSQALDIELIDFGREDPPAEVVRLAPAAAVERHEAFPVRYDAQSGTLTVAFSDPTNNAAIEDIHFQTGKKIRVAVAPEGQIQRAIRRHHHAGEFPAEAPVDDDALFDRGGSFLTDTGEIDLGFARLTNRPTPPAPEPSQDSAAPILLTDHIDEVPAAGTPVPDRRLPPITVASAFLGEALPKAQLAFDRAPTVERPSPVARVPSFASRMANVSADQDEVTWSVPPPTADGDPAHFSRALARLLIRKGLIDEGELLSELSHLS